MFKKIINKIKNSKKRNKDKADEKVFDLNYEQEIEELNTEVEVEIEEYNELPSNVILLNEYAKKKNARKIVDLSNKELVNVLIEDKSCLECNASLGDRTKKSALSDSRDYMYICCSNCGCVMKLNNHGIIKNTKNVLKQVSDAYILFKKVSINPKSYSYTRSGERIDF